ncbi:hypothetical protein BH09GEM1_BH09GEM1_13740 [soil metagenome]
MRRSSLGILFAFALFACRADVITDDVTSYAGDYTLRTVNGFVLPYAVLKTTSVTLEITDETFSLSSGGSFTDVTHYRRTENPTVTFPSDTLRGTFTVRGQTASFTTSKGDLFSGTIGASEFTVEGSSTIFYYKK